MIIVKSIFWSHQRSIWCTYMINTSNSPWIIQGYHKTTVDVKAGAGPVLINQLYSRHKGP